MMPVLMLPVRTTLSIASVLLLACLPRLDAAPTAQIEFNRDIRPIITENCFACHGPDKNQRKAKLRLDMREVAIERQAVVPGKPEESKLIEHIFSEDPEEIMPPPKSRKSLTANQKELLRRWIASGAAYEPHWAYIKVQRPAVPSTENAIWVRDPIDAYILHILEQRHIQPSPEASKATLLRRLSLDLIGLPPTPEELSAYLNDSTPAAYERQVERLLNSPHFGERMAVPWLDVVRYADTVGYHGDQNQNIFPYRDYVIDSFNRNKSFDQFTVEQLAGDLLPKPTVEQQIASGFNRLNMVTREGGAQPKEYLAKYAADRVRTVSMAWLGSTMGCAECHDHKYDPFTSKDFYQMEAFFADIKQWGVYADYDYTPNADLKGYGNDHPFPPEIEVENGYLNRRIQILQRQHANECNEAAEKLRHDPFQRAEYERWRKTSLNFISENPSGWCAPTPAVTLRFKDTNTVSETNFVVNADGAVHLSNVAREATQLSVILESNLWINAIRIEAEPEVNSGKADATSPKYQAAALSLTASVLDPGTNGEKRLAFCCAEADHKTVHYLGGRPVVGVKDRWDLSTKEGRQTAIWILEKPLRAAPGSRLQLDLGGFPVASVRVSVSPFAAAQPLDAGIGVPLAKALGKIIGVSRAERDLAARTFLLSTHFDPARVADLRSLEEEVRQCRHGRARTMVTVARDPLVTRVLRRGNWQDEGGDLVAPLVPHFLPQVPNPDHRRLTRLDLARWIVSPENPLTSRAVVNRLWKQFFGTGLSAVVDDLGAQGEWPIHPELIDWLAAEFMHPTASLPSAARPDAAFPWDLKHMVRLIVMSSTYRQESNQRPDLKDVDPNNRLLACQSPRRLEAEFVRDNALVIAGLLNGDIGGPSVFPYQPAGYYSYLQWPDRDYHANKDERQYRRGLYTHWQRAFLHPMLANFDAPSREECTANRIVSDTPQQALTLLNDPTFVEASRVFAARVLTSADSDSSRLDAAFRRAVARTPKQAERESLLSFLAVQREHYKGAPAEAEQLIKVGNTPPARASDSTELAAWTQVCRVILNLHETITRF
jgi:hypothetical protein